MILMFVVSINILELLKKVFNVNDVDILIIFCHENNIIHPIHVYFSKINNTVRHPYVFNKN